MNILELSITTALTRHIGPVFQSVQKQVRNLAVEFEFTEGTGGTSVDAYLQTSFDGQATWADIANFHVTTTSLKHLINLSSLTPVTTPVVPSDGALTANTCIDGLLGDYFRVLVTSAGTYAAGTALAVNVASATTLARATS